MSWSERLRGVEHRFSRMAWLPPVAVVVISFAWLWVSRSALVTNFDTARDWTQAVACANGDEAACRGTFATWFHGVAHGALWIRFLALGHRLDLSVAALQGLTLLFIAIGAGFVTVTARKLVGVVGAMAAGLAYAYFSLPTIQAYQFWNPTLLPLPIAIFTWALVDHARTGRATTGVVAAIAAAVSCDLHLVCTSLVPLLLVVNVASARRLGLANVLVLLAFVLPLWFAAPNTWANNLEVLDERAPALLGVVLPLATAVGLVLRGPSRKVGPGVRSAVVLGAMSAWFVVATWNGGLVGRYLAPALPAAAIGLGWFFQRMPLDWRGIARVCVGVWVITTVPKHAGLGRRPEAGRWTLEDISRIGAALAENRWGGPSLWQRIGGLEGDELATLVAISREHPSPAEGSMTITRVGRSELPPQAPTGWKVVELEGGDVAVLQPIRSALVRDQVEVCSFVEERMHACERGPFVPDASVFQFPPLQALFGAVLPADDRFRLEFRFEIDGTGMATPHVVEIVDADPHWRITKIEGVSFEGELPARRVTLRPSTGKGRIVFARGRSRRRHSQLESGRRGGSGGARDGRVLRQLERFSSQLMATRYRNGPARFVPAPTPTRRIATFGASPPLRAEL